jgi:hypothetical protein
MVCVQYITRCINGVLGREITKYTINYIIYMWFWPTLRMQSPPFSLCWSERCQLMGAVNYLLLTVGGQDRGGNNLLDTC